MMAAPLNLIGRADLSDRISLATPSRPWSAIRDAPPIFVSCAVRLRVIRNYLLTIWGVFPMGWQALMSVHRR